MDVIFDREDGVEHKAATNLESVDRIERSVRRTVRMISLLDFQQSRYRQLNERHSKSKEKRVETAATLLCTQSQFSPRFPLRLQSIEKQRPSDVPLRVLFCFSVYFLCVASVVKLTNRRVKQWTFLECMVVVLVTLVQVYLLKKQFPRDGGKRLAV